jgi:hypothetical protein
MILIYHCQLGVDLDLRLLEQFGPKVEAEAISFFGAAPIEWRIAPDDWRNGLRDGVHESMRAFHDLQRCIIRNGRLETRGIPVADCRLETRGIGKAIVHIHLRVGTYPEDGRPSFSPTAEGKRVTTNGQPFRDAQRLA